MQDLCTGLWAHAQLNFIRLVQAASASDLPRKSVDYPATHAVDIWRCCEQQARFEQCLVKPGNSWTLFHNFDDWSGTWACIA